MLALVDQCATKAALSRAARNDRGDWEAPDQDHPAVPLGHHIHGVADCQMVAAKPVAGSVIHRLSAKPLRLIFAPSAIPAVHQETHDPQSARSGLIASIQCGRPARLVEDRVARPSSTRGTREARASQR